MAAPHADAAAAAAVDADLRADCVDIAIDAETTTPTSGSSDPSPTSFGASSSKPQSTLQTVELAGDNTETPEKVALRVKKEVEAKNVRMARLASVLSLVLEGGAAVLGLGVGVSQGSLSLMGFGMESFLDAIASALVLWRFKQPKARTHQNEEAEASFKQARDARRERNSSLGIGTTFMLTAVLLYMSALYKLVASAELQHEQADKDSANIGLILSLPLGVLFAGMAVWKLRLGKALKSQVLWKDGLCSALGSALALICAGAAILEETSANEEDMAKVDASASALIATILLVEGARTVKHNIQPVKMPEIEPMSA